MNRNSSHSERHQARAPRSSRTWWATPAALLATMLALPVNAATTTIPSDPLASGLRVAPNILFILDDSGSMAYDYMPDSVPKTSDPDVRYYAYTRNTLSYNPAISYQPWVKADGNRMTGGTSYSAVYGSFNLVGGSTINLGNSSSCKQFNRNSNSTTDENTGQEVCGGVQTFYVPKDTDWTDETHLGNGQNYYRYQILAGGSDIERGEWGKVVENMTATNVSPNAGQVRNNGVNTHTISGVPAGVIFVLTIKSTNSRHANYQLTDPSGDQVCDLTFGDSETRSCTVRPSEAGTYTLKVRDAYPDNNYSYYELSAKQGTSNRCGDGAGSYDWVNCESHMPNASRDLAAELTNYATWFSYHRTRIKAAKAGASEAFKPLGNRVRVGFRTIWGRGANHSTPIPVTKGDGRFINDSDASVTNRDDWYEALQDVIGYNGTPLKGALYQAGKYFEGTSNSGAYGPEQKSVQFSCRQNFTILTTDGYWNDNSNYTSVNEQDNSSGTTITGPNGKSYKYSAKTPYSSGYDNTLADVAMYFWKRDLRDDLTNNVPTSTDSDTHPKDGDPAFWQHMVTFGISIGLTGTKGWGSVDEVPQDASWPKPTDNSQETIDDLLHAAVNGHGAFVAATSPQEFSDGLAAALDKIDERTASFSNAGASDSTQLNTGTRIFTASYNSGSWTGVLRAENAVSGAEVWKTTSTGKFPAYGSRKIYTRSGALTDGVGADGEGGGTSFPSTTQLGVLARTGGPANYEVSASDNADYIKGKQTKEGSNAGDLRVRSTIMGDIVNSSPAYVADSNTVFIGANDGMLHAFNADSGKELFAYVPNIINFGNLADLSRGDYDHRWFVDGPIAITPKTLSPDGTKNILVGTLGRGGKGLYALDVTTPASFGTSDVLWESASSDNMGMVLGAPVLAKVRSGSGTTKSAVIAGNGINSTSDKAYLLVLDMSNGKVIREIPTDATAGNALFAPTGIYAADGKTLVYAYAGDLQGNVWKFDLTATSPASWTAKKIFHAEKTAGTPQPITGGIASAVDTRTNKRWIFFGTGSYMTDDDAKDVTKLAQSMYGVMDDITTGSAYTRSDLAARTVTADGAGERYFQDLTSTLIGTKHGWYVDLPDKGERIVQNAQMDGSFLVTASMMPSGDSCADASGSGYINAVTPFPDMLANGRSYFDLDGDGNTDDTGTSGHPTGSVKTSGMPTLPLLLPGQLRYQTSDGSGNTLLKGKPQWNRVSWRELRNE